MCKTQLPFCLYVMGIAKGKQPLRAPELKAACSAVPSSLLHIGDMWVMKHGLCFNLIESDYDKPRDSFFILQGKVTGITF